MFRIDRALVNLANPQPFNANVLQSSEKDKEEDPHGADEAAEGEHSELRGTSNETQIKYLEGVAQDLVEQASAEASIIIQKAEMEAVDIKADAWREGYAKGHAEAESAFSGKLSEEVQRLEAEKQKILEEDDLKLQNVLKEISQSREEMFARFEQEIVDLCLAISKKIINVAIEKDDSIFESILKNALNQMKREGKITIRVSPAEFDRFFSSGSGVFALGDESVTATMISDPTLKEGGLIVESDGETINAGVDSQLKYISLAFGQAENQTL